MSDQSNVRFEGGVNIAMKIPKADYEDTVRFYRDTLGLPVTDHPATGAPSVARTCSVEFGPVTLWLDRVDAYSRSDLWLELRTSDVPAAAAHLAGAGTPTCDEVEPFEDTDAQAHWIRNPAGVVHLLNGRPKDSATDSAS
ncbi:VOC family protein [Nocardiopsis halophila]|uniref:VOC family protein n=1 Tax=Nocardiopsis halophila TaxID=141692 RepID=UPI000348A5F7|nr:VOC family protein [Nocardiopsis halophila]